MKELTSRLSAIYSIGEAKAIVRLVLEQKFGLSWTDVLCDGISSLNAKQQAQLETIMHRLESGEPVQYVLGEAEFCGRMFSVKEGVLIPRPETECLCQIVNNLHLTQPHILDIGTGSGCIAITLALNIPDSRVQGWDISFGALAQAEVNARRLGAQNITFSLVDILNQERLPSAEPLFDVIVSNPPYICQREQADMEEHVLLHEPELALFVPDDDPLLFYRAITHYAKSGALHKGGHLFFEVNRAYAHETAELLKNNGFIDVFIKNDQFDNPRIVGGVLA